MPPILPNDSIQTQYAGLGEPAVYGEASSGPVAYNASSPVTVEVSIPKADAAGVYQPIVKRGKYRLRVSTVTAGTTIGICKITVDDGTNIAVVDLIPAGVAGDQLDIQRELPAIENASNNGGTSDNMPTNIINIKAIVAFTTTDMSGNSIGDIALEFSGSD
jgi:hypothetical protein